MKNKENVRYVYYLKNKTTELKYIGARYSKNCNPSDFWVTYFTSSKLIHALIKIYGVDDFEFKILKTFTNEYDTLKFERHLLGFAIKKDDYVNVHKNFLTDNKEDYFFNKEKTRKIQSFYGKMQAALKIGFHSVSLERRSEICSSGGKAASIVNKENKTGIFSFEVRKRQHETLKRLQISAFYDNSTRKEISSKGGKLGYFSKAYYEKNNLPDEIRIKMQSERGKVGGAKNKGFIWYNDGINTFKYTKKNQNELKFEEFLNKNVKFNKGRLINK